MTVSLISGPSGHTEINIFGRPIGFISSNSHESWITLFRIEGYNSSNKVIARFKGKKSKARAIKWTKIVFSLKSTIEVDDLLNSMTPESLQKMLVEKGL